MPQIPQSTIDKIRDLADIVEVIGEEIDLKRKGASYKGLCPFHDDTEPSLSVSPSKQWFKCFSCDKSGNAISFIMEKRNLTFVEAIELLAKRYNVILDKTENYSSGNEYSFIKNVHEDASNIFQNNLSSEKGKKPLQYLEQRNLTKNIIKKFKIGFALDSWNDLINEIGPKYNNETQKLLKTGLFGRSKKGTIYDRFRSRIIFPISNPSGEVIAFGGRDYDKNDQAKYLNSPETAIYQKSNTLYGYNMTRGAINDIKATWISYNFIRQVLSLLYRYQELL